ncbi:MAG: asparagine synthase (glutamine-hydrolyzing) [Desulfobacteraceae bacterium]|nr:asparagine synthase (glutamine-hydrolyzing) [Desulfobacteraceae bacterium]
MCGICGIINFNNRPVQDKQLTTMMLRMKHRGPDDDGLFSDGNVAFGFVRLSILDLSTAGHQPMYSHDNRYVIVYNGEIYNYIELRKELKHKYQFKTGTDTEVVLAAYQEWGENCLHKFNGMFAFVIYDTKLKEIFGARDRFGIKPFYYYQDNNKFVFASEIPPILSALDNKPEANEQVVFDYLAFNRTDQTQDTFFKNIYKLQHGHSFRIKNSELRFQKWYDLKQHVGNPFNSPAEYKDLFSDSIKLRLRSDVPVGVCLSGGLDSSSIVSVLLNDFDKKDLNTFSAVYGKNEISDESEFIAEYNNLLNNMYYTQPSAESLFADKEDFVNTHAEPIPSTGPYAQYKVMELAENYVVVTLDGQGADEQLAGYHYFFGFYFKDLLCNFSILKFLSESYHYLIKHQSLYGFKTLAYFLLPETIKANLRTSEHGYINNEFTKQYASSNTITSNLYGAANLNAALFDHFEYKLEHLLKWEDRNSMRFSLESRVPFLDHRLVERILASSANQIIHKGMTKHILREAMKGILPERLRMRRDKVGFDTPQDKWFRTEQFSEYIQDVINSNYFKEMGYIDQNKANKLFQKHMNKKINIAKEIWKWINIDLWHKQFIQ